jgi:hypothetical protein
VPVRVTARAAAALVLALVAVAGCSGGIDELQRDPSTTSTTVALIAPTITTEAPRQGLPLVVTEQGVSSFTDPFDEATTLGGYAVVLQNPNPTLLASGVHVTTRILDAAGNQLLVDNALLNGIMPGARMAVGRTIIEDITGETQLDVSVEVSAWLTPAFTEVLTAEGASTAAETYGGALTHFGIRSTLPAEETGVDVTAVYRAADGRILGGESTTLDSVPVGATVVGQIALLAPIPGTTTTEVFVGRGLAAQTTG